MAHVAESTHWYTKDGEPMYTVPYKNGDGERPTTLRDARKLRLVPSVTEIIKMAAAPGLEAWKQNQVLLAALTLPRIEGEGDEDFVKRVMDDSKEHARQAAEKGTAIHAAIQGLIEGTEGTIADKDLLPFAEPAARLLENMGEWRAEVPFAHPLGYGGKVDLDGVEIPRIIDIKTKEFFPGQKLRTWDNHAMQLAAYREGLGKPDADCGILYVSVSHPRTVEYIPIDEDEMKRGWKMFTGLLSYWKAAKQYDPDWGEGE